MIGLWKRDWILLPALSLFTICLLAGSSELVSRWLYPASQVGFENCFATDDPVGDAPVKPNSVCWEQTPESSTKVEYRFNREGDRAGVELEPKTRDTFRIVLMGSSLTQGLFVPRERTFAALLPIELTKIVGRTVEVYNEATGGKFRGGPFPTRSSTKRLKEVLAAQPDLILWVITPTDVLNSEPAVSLQSAPQAAETITSRSTLKRLADFLTQRTVAARLRSHWEETRTSIVLKHWLISSESQSEYIRSYLANGDNASFLEAAPDAKWQTHLDAFGGEADKITGLAKSAGCSFGRSVRAKSCSGGNDIERRLAGRLRPIQAGTRICARIVSHGGHFSTSCRNTVASRAPSGISFPWMAILMPTARQRSSSSGEGTNQRRRPRVESFHILRDCHRSRIGNNGLGIPAIRAVRIDCCGGHECFFCPRLALDRAAAGQLGFPGHADRSSGGTPAYGWLSAYSAIALSLFGNAAGAGRGLEHPGGNPGVCMVEEVHLLCRNRCFLRRPYFTLGLSYIFFRVLHLLKRGQETQAQTRRKAHRLFLLSALYAKLHDPRLRSNPALR